MDARQLNRYVKRLAADAGFQRCGCTAAGPVARGAYLRAWLDAGRAGSMAYLHRNFAERTDPSRLLDGARSVVVVALVYHQRAPAPPADDAAPRGRVAMYAWGDDYHRVMKDKLFAVADRMRDELEEPFAARVCVDTAPLLERELAAAAGIGWIGKNTMLLDADLGSYCFLGVIVTTLDIEPDEPVPDHCGTCTRCLTACPTDAFPAPYEMDASRCISYLTIEHRGTPPAEFHGAMGDWIFGCDVCQAVCPYNRDAPTTREPSFSIRPPGPSPALDDVLGWSVDDYRMILRRSAIKRAKLDMLQRNAAIAKRNASGRCSSGAPANTGS
ncbi:MAG: tRNA epoxyqueuosine(34) reductase QueG [Phycisphaerae bacterium]